MTRADLRKPGAAIALLLALLLGFEGVRYTAYRDVAGVPTICAGRTEGVTMGMTATKEMCEDFLRADAMKYWLAVDAAVKVEMTPWQWVALTSFSFNMGVGALQSSTMLKLINQNRWADGCRQLPRWNKARKGPGGPKVPWPGLIKRRTAELFYCMGWVFDHEFSPNHRPRRPLT